MTTVSKLEKIYFKSEKLLKASSPDESKDLSVSITYAGGQPMILSEAVKWFFRDPRETQHSTKRAGYSESQRDRSSGDSKKKRRIRDDKQVDIGSLLGTFT